MISVLRQIKNRSHWVEESTVLPAIQCVSDRKNEEYKRRQDAVHTGEGQGLAGKTPRLEQSKAQTTCCAPKLGGPISVRVTGLRVRPESI